MSDRKTQSIRQEYIEGFGTLKNYSNGLVLFQPLGCNKDDFRSAIRPLQGMDASRNDFLTKLTDSQKY